jgi:hypothetical protein
VPLYLPLYLGDGASPGQTQARPGLISQVIARIADWLR